jgi:hypothetical protein
MTPHLCTPAIRLLSCLNSSPSSLRLPPLLLLDSHRPPRHLLPIIRSKGRVIAAQKVPQEVSRKVMEGRSGRVHILTNPLPPLQDRIARYFGIAQTSVGTRYVVSLLPLLSYFLPLFPLARSLAPSLRPSVPPSLRPSVPPSPSPSLPPSLPGLSSLPASRSLRRP